MRNQNILRGLFMMAVGLAFGLGALRYKIGSFAEAGPGLFPLVVSAILVTIGAADIVRARFVDPIPVEFPIRKFAIVIGSLVLFAAVSHFANMTIGILVLVFCASTASAAFSWKRNVAVTAALVGVAFVMHRLLGLELPLY